MKDEKRIHCSFCGRDKKDTNVLIAGITGHICDNCISQAGAIVKEELGSNNKNDLNFTLLKPKEIKKHLDEYVIGQEDAKKSTFSSCLQSLQTNYQRKLSRH